MKLNFRAETRYRYRLNNDYLDFRLGLSNNEALLSLGYYWQVIPIEIMKPSTQRSLSYYRHLAYLCCAHKQQLNSLIQWLSTYKLSARYLYLKKPILSLYRFWLALLQFCFNYSLKVNSFGGVNPIKCCTKQSQRLRIM